MISEMKVLSAFVLLPALFWAADWKLADAPLTTQWTAKVAPSNAWREYPRPHLQRPNWTNLNGLWDYAIVADFDDEAAWLAYRPQAPHVAVADIINPMQLDLAIAQFEI